MPVRFESELSLASREISRIRGEIAHADAIILSPSVGTRERAAAHRAAAYVWLASILERVVRTALQDTLQEISSLAMPSNGIRISLFSLICDAEFDSVAARNKSTAWSVKTRLLSRVLDQAPAVLTGDVLPLDSGTIRADHFDTIWLVLGLSGNSVPSAHHRFALKDLADGRNEVAHGHRDPVSFGRAKASSDVLRLTYRIDDVITNFLGELDAYLVDKQFAR